MFDREISFQVGKSVVPVVSPSEFSRSIPLVFNTSEEEAEEEEKRKGEKEKKRDKYHAGYNSVRERFLISFGRLASLYEAVFATLIRRKYKMII